jgi:hypothetical protein
MTSTSSRYLRRREASAYLREQHGVIRAPATLAKLAVTGGGPKFRHVGKIPIYPIEELDAFAAAITSPLRASTSDRSSAGVATTGTAEAATE